MERNPQTDLVHPGERVDDLQNGFYVIQNPEKFCFGMKKADLTNKEWNFVRQLKKQWKEEESKDENI